MKNTYRIGDKVFMKDKSQYGEIVCTTKDYIGVMPLDNYLRPVVGSYKVLTYKLSEAKEELELGVAAEYIPGDYVKYQNKIHEIMYIEDDTNRVILRPTPGGKNVTQRYAVKPRYLSKYEESQIRLACIDEFNNILEVL